jgi:hypothetical protein
VVVVVIVVMLVLETNMKGDLQDFRLLESVRLRNVGKVGRIPGRWTCNLHLVFPF